MVFLNLTFSSKTLPGTGREGGGGGYKRRGKFFPYEKGAGGGGSFSHAEQKGEPNKF